MEFFLCKRLGFALGIVVEILFALLSSGQKDWNEKPARTPKNINFRN